MFDQSEHSSVSKRAVGKTCMTKTSNFPKMTNSLFDIVDDPKYLNNQVNNILVGSKISDFVFNLWCKLSFKFISHSTLMGGYSGRTSCTYMID